MLKLLASNLSVLRSCCNAGSCRPVFTAFKRYENTLQLDFPEELPKYEVSKDEKEWEYVERLLPDTVIPEVQPKEEYPSGWTPQNYHPDMPYVVQRTRNQLLPIYLNIGKKHRGLQRNTRIKKIHGDIWQMASDIKNYLEPISKTPVHIKIHEITGTIIVRGDHVNNLKIWALERHL